jgi:hypothetical protein
MPRRRWPDPRILQPLWVRDIAGYGRCLTDFMTGKVRDYGCFDEPELWRAILCEEGLGK